MHFTLIKTLKYHMKLFQLNVFLSIILYWFFVYIFILRLNLDFLFKFLTNQLTHSSIKIRNKLLFILINFFSMNLVIRNKHHMRHYIILFLLFKNSFSFNFIFCICSLYNSIYITFIYWGNDFLFLLFLFNTLVFFILIIFFISLFFSSILF